MFAVSLITRPGFEPGQTEPKSVVLPLHYRVSRDVIYRMNAWSGKGRSDEKISDFLF